MIPVTRSPWNKRRETHARQLRAHARAGALVALTAALVAFSGAVQGSSWLIVISGVGGDSQHRKAFVEMSLAMIDAAQGRFGLPADHVIYLAEKQELAPDRIDGRSTRDEIEVAIRTVASAAAPGDQVIILLIGHGTSQGREARFGLPGPDMTAADFAELLQLLADQNVAFVNTASASGGFVAALSGPRRTVVTATRGPQQREATLFPRYFVDAFALEGADLDHDQSISILEAFTYATSEVARAYEADGRLRTEHALLDDNGDGVGSTEPDPRVGDGALARRLGLGPAMVSGRDEVPTETADDAELAALLGRRAEFQDRLEKLREHKAELQQDRYFELLEELLVQIAHLDAAIREREGSHR